MIECPFGCTRSEDSHSIILSLAPKGAISFYYFFASSMNARKRG